MFVSKLSNGILLRIYIIYILNTSTSEQIDRNRLIAVCNFLHSHYNLHCIDVCSHSYWYLLVLLSLSLSLSFSAWDRIISKVKLSQLIECYQPLSLIYTCTLLVLCEMVNLKSIDSIFLPKLNLTWIVISHYYIISVIFVSIYFCNRCNNRGDFFHIIIYLHSFVIVVFFFSN